MAAVWAGLRAAAMFAETFGDDVRQAKYNKAKDEIKDAALKYLYDEERKRFVRRLNVDQKTGQIDVDLTIDSSVYGLFYFGMFDANDPKVISTMYQVNEQLWCKNRCRRSGTLRERLLSSGDTRYR